MDFQLASIAGAGIDLAYRQTAAEPPPRRAAGPSPNWRQRRGDRQWRQFGEGPAKQAFEKQLAHR